MNVNRQTAMIGVLVLAVTAAMVDWVVLPVLDYRASLAEDIRLAGRTLGDVRSLAGQYRRLSGELQTAKAQDGSDQTLFALLETTAARSGIRPDSMRPSVRQDMGGFRKDVVEMRLTSVPLQKLMEYLVAVEGSGRGVRVERLNLRAHDDRPLDAELVFTVLTPQEES